MSLLLTNCNNLSQFGWLLSRNYELQRLSSQSRRSLKISNASKRHNYAEKYNDGFRNGLYFANISRTR